jgi:hypothetical protein
MLFYRYKYFYFVEEVEIETLYFQNPNLSSPNYEEFLKLIMDTY